MFNQPGVIAHVSATGAASYPQSEIDGAQYARLRAIDGQAFENHHWIAMATTYDPQDNEVKAYLNGEMTPLKVTDPVLQDIFQYDDTLSANPFRFDQAICSPRSFVIKFNGYSYQEKAIVEHRIRVDLEHSMLIYQQDYATINPSKRFRIHVDILRDHQSMLPSPLIQEVTHQDTLILPATLSVDNGDKIKTHLEVWKDRTWHVMGSPVVREITEGAPFTFGRALGLGTEDVDHGSQLYLDGVAVFNRILTEAELQKLSFDLGSKK